MKRLLSYLRCLRDPLPIHRSTPKSSTFPDWALAGPDLRARPHGGPDPVPGDARAWALERLGIRDR